MHAALHGRNSISVVCTPDPAVLSKPPSYTSEVCVRPVVNADCTHCRLYEVGFDRVVCAANNSTYPCAISVLPEPVPLHL